jgi:mannose-1-phosphate guanylyltransferase/mannose-6-phosphate isomerase
MNDSNLFCIILAGGSGSRFWPLSRETWPKQMLQIAGEESLLRQTIKRVSGFFLPQNIWIVTTEDKAQDIGFHLEALGAWTKEIRYIKEPFGKNTAPAVGLAAVYLYHLSPDSVMAIMPSDHAIPDTDKFLTDLGLAIQGAKEDHLVTFGIKPDRPETGYGYIKVGKVSGTKKTGLLPVERFFEKPDLQTAKIYLLDGSYFWNSGIFVWKTSKILSEIKRHLPSLFRILEEIEAFLFTPSKPTSKSEQASQIRHLYDSMESISIDYGVMERSENILMVPAQFRWSDVGSWTALEDIIEKDEDGNILRGNTIDIGSRNSIIFSGERLVATIGLKDAVVVDTPDATLVTSKERVQEVRKVVEALKKSNREEHLVHRTVERPWGNYTVLEKGNRYKIKRIVLHPKAKLSLQIHRHRSEHWVAISGTARVTRGDEVFDLHPNESTFIPISVKHRLENPGIILLQIIEVQNGDYVEEDDIERFDDEYGR